MKSTHIVTLSGEDMQRIARIVYESSRALYAALDVGDIRPWHLAGLEAQHHVETIVRLVGSSEAKTPEALHNFYLTRRLQSGARPESDETMVAFDELPAWRQLAYYQTFTNIECLLTGFALVALERQRQHG